MNNRDRKFIGMALEESSNSTNDRIHIGAVAAMGNVVLGKGANLKKAHPVQYRYNMRARRPTNSHGLHAEMHALLAARGFNGASLYVARLDRRGKLAMCRPCKACRLAMKQAGITEVFYTTPQGVKHEVVATNWQ